MLAYTHAVAAGYLEPPHLFNSPPNAVAFAAPVPCDSPTLDGYGAAAFAKPLLFAAYPPANYAPSVPQINYAAPPASFVKYAAQPHIKATAGLPVTTTFTTAVGYTAPQVAFASQNNPAAFVAPAPSYAAPVSYAKPPAFLGPTSYAAPTLLAAQPFLRKFRIPFSTGGNVYAQAAAW